jgi:hypothetical protein
MIISRRIRWAGHVAYVVLIINAKKIMIGKPEADRPPAGTSRS